MDRFDNDKSARRKRTSEEIEDALRASGLSRKEFAIKMGRQPSEVTKWLSAKHNFTSDLLAEISAVLKTPISGAADKITKGKLVSGYGTATNGPVLEDSAYVLGHIDLPSDIIDILNQKAIKSGMSLRGYIKDILCSKAKEKTVSAYDFNGIWPEDAEGCTELYNLRTKNSLKEL